MWKSTKAQAVALAVVCGILGYVAASTDVFRTTAAAPSVSAAAPESTCDKESCCSDAGRAARLVAAHNVKVSANLQKDGKKPNILVIFGDDVGYWNVSAYSR